MVGNFDNPAGYASVPALGLPAVLYFTFSKRRRYRSAAWIVYGLSVIGIVLSGSRTGILVALLLSASYVVRKYRSLFSRISRPIKILAVMAAISIAAGLYLAKKDSANGRILIWRCTWDMIKEKPLTGHGHKSFESDYMLYQARYFEQNPDSKFASLSDNVKHPFNEFLLVAAEFGVIAIAAVILLAAMILIKYRRDKSNVSFACISIVTAIIIFSCFSYPFKYPFTWIVLASSIALLLKPVPRVSKFAIPVFSLALLGYTVNDIYYENRWYGAADSEYERLYPHFESNGYFLYNYASQLNRSGEYEKSLRYAKECSVRLNDYDVQMLIADNYNNLSDRDESLRHYTLACRMCPNRFMPLYRQFVIYDDARDSVRADSIAREIVCKPVNPSGTVASIVRKMDEHLNGQSRQ